MENGGAERVAVEEGRGRKERKAGGQKRGGEKKTFGGSKSFFPPPCPVTCSNPPGPTKAHKTFGGLTRFFPPPCPRHMWLTRLVPQKPTKLSGPEKFFLISLAPGAMARRDASCTRTHDTYPPRPDLPTLIISYFSFNSPEVSFRITYQIRMTSWKLK